MGYRLSKIYTRQGDNGTTGLGDGSRVPKDALRVETYGTIDELNSAIGLVLAQAKLAKDVADTLLNIQHELFELGGELCIPTAVVMKDEHTCQLEAKIDALNESLPPLKEFILPGGSLSAAHCHMARTICRRAERQLTQLAREEDINPASLHYLNRLSDYLFVAARTLARVDGGQEVLWQRG